MYYKVPILVHHLLIEGGPPGRYLDPHLAHAELVSLLWGIVFSCRFNFIMCTLQTYFPTMYLKAACITLLALSVGSRGQSLSCNDVPDLMKFCEAECGDSTLKDVECSATGPSCFCLNAAGDIENTNIDAPTLCGGKDLSEACAKECGAVPQIEGFDCENDKPVCSCAKDDGIEGVGADATQEDKDYADAQDAIAEELEDELEKNPLPVPSPLAIDEVVAATPAAATDMTPSAMAPAASEASTEPEVTAGSGSMIAGTVAALMVTAAGLVIA